MENLQIIIGFKMNMDLLTEEVILNEGRTTDEDKLRIMEGKLINQNET